MYAKYILQEDKTKFRCVYNKCNKLFCGPEFVQKHIRLKHIDLINSVKQKVSLKTFSFSFFLSVLKNFPQGV